MNTADITHAINQYLQKLGIEEQKQILEFTRSVSHSRLTGISGSALLPFIGAIPPRDLELMREAIENDCEKVTPNEW